MRMDGDKVGPVRIGLTNLAPAALRATDAEKALIGQPLTDATLDAAAKAAMAMCDPAEDLRGSVDYKRAMAGQMLKRALREAAARCQ
jgi:carbon-monoxide dehydrogenase medium subunit